MRRRCSLNRQRRLLDEVKTSGTPSACHKFLVQSQCADGRPWRFVLVCRCQRGRAVSSLVGVGDRHLKTDGGSLPGGTVALKARLGRQVVNVCIHGVSVRPQGHDCRAHHMLDPPRAHERVACYTTNVTLLQPSQSVGGVGLMPGTMPFICPCEPRELQVRKDALHMSSRHQPNTADRLPFICPCEPREHAAATCAQRIGYSPCGGAAAIAPASCVSARS